MLAGQRAREKKGPGIETARALALANAHVVMFCRNVQAAEELKKKICTEKVIN